MNDGYVEGEGAMAKDVISRDGGEVSVSIRTEPEGTERLTLTIEGRLDVTTTGAVWRQVMAVVQKAPWQRIVVDASGIDYCDGAGVGLLVELCNQQNEVGGELEIRGLRPEFQRLLDLFDPAVLKEAQREKPRPVHVVEQVGWGAVGVWKDIHALIAFVGELCVALGQAVIHPRRVRWKDAFFVAETAGVNALPIVALISFLVGLIVAFQSAIALKQFGAEVFIAELIAISMIRELGPLMTAILLAGRSGSAFAAELGTMKVNEEIDALTTMGLDSVRFLVVPRVIASLVLTPLLAVFADIIGMMGGALVSVSLGYALATYTNRAVASIGTVDFLGGLFKALVFGILIAAIGCLRGLQTKIGPSAVGEAATRAVVSGIVLIVIADGIFGVVFYALGF
jgi:phospholipid/cholesterol/gamma-HCH transport system permease protein